MKIHQRLVGLVLLILLCSCLTIPAFAAEPNLVYGIGFTNTDSLRLRSEPDFNAIILSKAPKNECVVILEDDSDWYKVSYNLQTGYMHKSYLDVLTAENAELGYGTVTGSSVNLRKGPGESYPTCGTITKGSRCYIIGINKGWYKVIDRDQICYVRSDFLELTEIPYENQQSTNAPKFYRLGKSTGIAPSAALLNKASTATPSGSTSILGITGDQILEEAKKYLGVRYKNGGATPDGFDCSGYVYYVLKSLGYVPYRTPADQYNMGTPVEKADLEPGDLVFFAGTYASGISHVGIYAGNGQFIHAPNSRSTVSYSDLTSGYWAQHYYGARRMG